VFVDINRIGYVLTPHVESIAVDAYRQTGA
jgi:hypothetical protein